MTTTTQGANVTTLTEFLTARLDEDEAVARAATTGPWEIDHPTSRQVVFRGRSSATENLLPETVVYDSGFGADSDAEFVARFHSARVLAEVEAKRRIVEYHYSWSLEAERNPGPPFGPILQAKVIGAEAVLRALAMPYADHPDYDEAWRP